MCQVSESNESCSVIVKTVSDVSESNEWGNVIVKTVSGVSESNEWGNVIVKTVSGVSVSLQVTITRLGDSVGMFIESERPVLSDAKECNCVK